MRHPDDATGIQISQFSVSQFLVGVYLDNVRVCMHVNWDKETSLTRKQNYELGPMKLCMQT